MDLAVVTNVGRTLAVFDSGEGDRSILSIHGGGMGRTVYAPYLEMVTARGARVLSYDRPGLGGSSRNPGYLVGDCAADVRAIASDLNLERLAVWGISGGAPFALACAALLPDLVVGAAALAGRAAPKRDAMPEILMDPAAGLAEFEAEAAAQREREVPEWIDVLTATGLPAAD